MKENYRENERKKAIDLVKNTDLFSHEKSGLILKWKGKKYPKDEILLDGISNIYEPIRKDVLYYFIGNNISFWHVPKAKETVCKPTGHILSSQVCCINHLFPIRHDKENVLKIAKVVSSGFIDVLPITTDKYMPDYIQFESVSDNDHLNEGQPTRGRNCTSIDALIYAVHSNGKKYIIPIEWKYTENYGNKDKSVEDRNGEPKGNKLRGNERLKRYTKLIDNSKFLKHSSPHSDSIYFLEPFYQLMRQTLWAEQMLEHKNSERIKADDYIHVHIIPNENNKLLNKKYKVSNKSMKEIWLDTLEDKEKYIVISPKDFIKNIDKNKYGDLLEYIKNRYWRVD